MTGRRFFRAPARSNPAAAPFLYPPGTTFSEIPALARGLTEMEYLDYCIEQSKKAVPEPIPVQAAPVPQFGARRRTR